MEDFKESGAYLGGSVRGWEWCRALETFDQSGGEGYGRRGGGEMARAGGKHDSGEEVAARRADVSCVLGAAEGDEADLMCQETMGWWEEGGRRGGYGNGCWGRF
jgi:hypothetical protein